MDKELEKLVDDAEASWPTTKELAFVIDDPLEKLMEKAKKIFKGRHWDTLDALAVRIADAVPGGVSEENFDAAEPIAGAARKYFANIEKLRTGLNRPFLDAKKAVDEAAKQTLARAEPTLKPVIDAVKKIQDRRKREEEAKAEAERKRVEDERLAAEQAHRDMIKAQHAADMKRLADEAAENRRQAEEMAARNKRANDELAELRRQIEQMSAPVPTTKELNERIVQANKEETVRLAGEKVAVVVDETRDWPPTLLPSFDDDAPPLPPLDLPVDEPPVVQALRETLGATMVRSSDYESVMLDADTSAEYSLAGVEVNASADQQKVRDFGMAVKVFVDGLKRPLLVKHEAVQAVELAVFDIYGVANSLQEWRMP